MNRLIKLGSIGSRPARSAVVAVVITAALAGAWWLRRPNIERLLTEAKRALNRNDRAAATARLDAILERDPAHALARLYRGQIARDAGDLAGALAHWSAIGDQPAKTGATARYLQGTLLLELHQARAAEANLRRASELNSDYLPPHERLVELYVTQMRRDETRRELAAVGRLRSWKIDELVMYTLAGERVTAIEEGIGLMQHFVETDPDDLVSGLSLARYLSAAGRGDEALELTGRLAARFPADERILARHADELLRRSDLTNARQTLARCRLTPRSDVTYWRSLGNYWFEAENWANAAACLGEVVGRDPEDLPARYRLGTALARSGHPEDAALHLQRAELLDKLQREALRIPQRDRRQAEAILPIVIETARLLEEVQRFQEATWWYQEAQALDRGDPRASAGVARAARLASAARLPRPAPVPSESLVRGLQIEMAGTAAEVASRPEISSRIVLRDVASQAGIDFQYFNGQTGFKYLLESMGGGVAVLDFDGDGWPDLFFPQGCRLPYNPGDLSHLDRLYRNRGDGTFEDVTARSGLGDNRYGQGCAVGDYDNDGDPDLFVANFGRSIFYCNNGDGTFRDATEQAGILADKWCSSAAFADFDRDGNLDLYVVTYVDSLKVCRADDGRITTCDPQNFNAEPDILFRNRGDGTLEDVSGPAGVLAPDGKGLGIVTADLDGDGWPEIYVANDGTPNFLFRNLGGSGPRFREEGMVSGAAVDGDGRAEAGMGLACADFNGDGLLDLFVTNFYLETSTLYVNLGGGLFQDATRAAGLDAPTKYVLGFGAQAIDFDRDGWPDLLIANGHIDDYRFRNEPWKMSPQLFRNLGRGVFGEVSHEAGEYFQGEYLGRGVARLDWNRDGLPDAVVVHQDRPVALLSNETPDAGGGLVLELHGVESNRDAIGARLRVTAEGRTQVLEICGGDGFYCSNERRQFIGLGAAVRIELLEIDWPSGRRDRWIDLPVSVLIVAVEGRSPGIRPLSSPEVAEPLRFPAD